MMNTINMPESLTRQDIVIVGAGYVGLSLAVLFARDHVVTVVDIDAERVCKINRRVAPIADRELERCLATGALSLTATTDSQQALKLAHFIVVATPTDYDADSNRFDTSSVDGIVSEAVSVNPTALIVIKSTVPVGYTAALQHRFKTNRIIFHPNFCARDMRCMTIYIRPESLLAVSRLTAENLYACCQVRPKNGTLSLS